MNMADQHAELHMEHEVHGGQMTHNIKLTATAANGQVAISGPTAPISLPPGSGAHPFNFTLTDNSGMNVRFLPAPDFLAVSETETCPAQANGITTDQIDQVHSSGNTARFIDKNMGAARTLGYALYFACSDPSQTPCFDPIINNGGSTAQHQ